jgi:hypothetical protein
VSMNENSYDSDSYQPKFGHRLFVIFFYISFSLLIVATASVILNWLDDFLHAPIGIKDYPPEPGLVVQIAQLAWIPLVLSVFLSGFFGFMSRVFKPVPLLLGTLIVTCGSISLVGGILGEYKGEELFHGQAFFCKTVTPILYVIFLMSWVGVGANHCIEKWRRDCRPRHLIAGLCVILGMIFGVIGLIGGAIGNESEIVYLMYGVFIAVLGYIIYIAPGKW